MPEMHVRTRTMFVLSAKKDRGHHDIVKFHI